MAERGAMAQHKTIGIRELRAGLAEKVQAMLDSGMASWSGQKPTSVLPRVSVRGPKALAELLLEDRE